MHNKLAGTKGFGRTIRIHNTPLPPDHHTYNLSHLFIHALSLHTDIQKQTKNNSNMDSLINTTCFHKVTESAN